MIKKYFLEFKKLFGAVKELLEVHEERPDKSTVLR